MNRRLPFLPACLLAGAALLWGGLPLPVVASDGHAPAADKPAPAKPAATKGKAAAAPAHAEPAPSALPSDAAVDPMETLRGKLAEKLGHRSVAPGEAPYDLKVVTRAPPAPAATAKGTRARVDVAGLAAAHRAEKAGQAHGAAGDGHAAHWSYDGADSGPEAWGRLKPEFGTCATGQRQSPIDIRGGIAVELDPIAFDYRASGFRVIDNGHTVQVNVEAGNSIQVIGRRYELVQFHFHRPSEERIDGRQFDMVAHLVHKDAQGRLAVVAVLLDRGSAHPLVQTVWNHLPLEKGEEWPAPVSIDLTHLLPQDRRYFTYMGSLTTPPCSEGVLWMVMKQPVPVSPEQINVFSKLYPMNARPVQAAAGRLIKQSN